MSRLEVFFFVVFPFLFGGCDILELPWDVFLPWFLGRLLCTSPVSLRAPSKEIPPEITVLKEAGTGILSERRSF